MKRLIIKDFLLLLRDFWGLALLFLMPWVLVVLMTYLQDSTFRSVNENRIPLYLLDNDNDSLGAMISRQILASNIFETTSSAKDVKLTENEVEKAVAHGDYMLGVIIPENATKKLRITVRGMVERAFNGEEADVNDGVTIHGNNGATVPQTPLNIKLLIDPAAKQSFRTTLIQAIRENALMVQNKLLLNEITRQVNVLVPVPIDLNFDAGEFISINESYASAGGKMKIIPDSTQHNVPAWSMFAIFFIVISLAGNMIRERETGCFNRLMTTPCSFSRYLLSKVCVYLCVCLLQLTLMLVTGMYVIPLFGLPELKLGHSIAALTVMSLTSSMAATGYGLAIGSIARTNQQASVFGAVSVVILAALGGVWIPTFLMPLFMQYISYLSPLNWGLNGFNDIFVRDSSLVEILPYAFTSLIFFAVTIFISCRANRRR